MTKKKAKKKSSKKEPNFFISTTIFAAIGVLVYWLVLKYLFSTEITWIQILIFFVIFWIVYYFIERRAYRKHGRRY